MLAASWMAQPEQLQMRVLLQMDLTMALWQSRSGKTAHNQGPLWDHF